MNKITISILSVLIATAIVGAYFFPNVTVKEVYGSPTNSTFTQSNTDNAMIAAPLSGTATSTSILNTSGSDLGVIQVNIVCEGVGTSQTAYTGAGLAALTLSIGTSSIASPTVIPTNLVGPAITIATSTGQFVLASTSQSTSWNDIWPAGSYMTAWFNATNTAKCHVGVETGSL